MRILVISRNAWDNTNSIGNTLSNFFTGIKDVEFGSVYFRSSAPNNEMCQMYYRATETEILKKWFSPAKIGTKLSYNCVKKGEHTTNTAERKERALVRLIQSHNLKFAYKLSDYLWYSEKWINKNLESFVAEFSPDLIVTFVKSAPQYYLTVKYLRERFNVPLFTWIADDEYTGLAKKGATREIENLKYILAESSVVTGCSQEICDYYNSVFGCNATPLYKSCDFTTPVKQTVNDPVTIVYAGNLLYGRMDIIGRVADAVEKVSAIGVNVVFEIYSNTELTESEVQKYIGEKKSTQYMGKRDYAFIKKRLASADVVLHVESFEAEQVLKTKYSFSTKIIDYLQSGSVLMAVGPNDIASMQYIAGIPGACVVNDIKNIDNALKEILTDATDLSKRALQTRSFAEEYHDSNIASMNLTKTFNEISKRGE